MEIFTFSSTVIRITLISVVSGFNWLVNHQVGSEHSVLCVFVWTAVHILYLLPSALSLDSCGMYAVALWASNTSTKLLDTFLVCRF